MNAEAYTRLETATKIISGFAANPAVFAPRADCGWSLCNCTDEDLIGYSLSLADKLIYASEEERADYLLKCNTDLNAHVRDLSEQLRKERSALAEAKELLREIRDNEVNACDEADKFLRDHVPSELSKAKARCVALEKEVIKANNHAAERSKMQKMANDNYDTVLIRAETAEAQRDRMKAALEEITECYFKRRSEGLLELMMRAAALFTPPAEEKP